ncbi:MAG: zinc ABC transporter substrate-binding protein [Deltaproteobacteria bacterium]|nr:zinc ABC transporter substrate-binding protein [Deltaproteobacteria bacterium]
MTTIAPLAMIVQDLGGDHVTASSLVSGASSVHTYEPSPSDLVRIAGADLLVSIGGELDGWLDKLLVGKKPGAIVVRLLEDGVTPTASHDPHVWLDPLWVRDRALASLVRALSAIDPPTEPQYAASARRISDGLTDLDEDIRAILVGTAGRGFLAFHPAWSWFAARFDLHPVGAVEESGGTEPSAGALAALLDAAREAKIRAILVEPQMDPRLARTVASEIGADVVLVDPLGDLASSDRGRYRDLMLFNAYAFARALIAGAPPAE